jgi:glycosyltransferase involved in cell wall biosynthesis
MKVLHVLLTPRAEGTPRLVLDWLEVKDLHQELLFLSPEGELKEMFEETSNWQYYNSHFPLGITNVLKIASLVFRICKKRRPDVVISWPMGFSQWIHLGARFAGVKRLIVYGGNPPGTGILNRYLFTYLSFWTGCALGNIVLTCSNYIRDEYRKIPLLSKRQFQTVYNCFKATKFINRSDIGRRKGQVIMVATLEKHKDYKTLLIAWKEIEKRGLDYTLKIAGDGSLGAELRKMSEGLGLITVEFLGSRRDIPELLHESNVFVLSTTRQEGFGTVLLEALASGCQVVATDVPACREVLESGRYGTLVPPEDALALANAILRRLEHNFLPDELQRQVDYTIKFSPENMVKNYFRQLGAF